MGSVHFPAQQLVQGGIARQDDGLIHALHAPSAESRQVSANADRATRHESDGQSFPEGPRVGGRNGAAAREALYS